MREHAQFEIMCALAATGHLADAEMEQLRQHAEDCSECGDRIVDFASVSAQGLLPQFTARRAPKKLPKGMEKRFHARARAEGIALRELTDAMRVGSLSVAAAVGAALLLAWLFVGLPANPVYTRNATLVLRASGDPQDSLPAKIAGAPISGSAFDSASGTIAASSHTPVHRRREKRPTMLPHEEAPSNVAFSLPDPAAAHFTIPPLRGLPSTVSDRNSAQPDPEALLLKFAGRAKVLPHYVFRYVAHDDSARRELSYVPPNIDWYRFFVRSGDLSSATWDRSTR